MSEIRGEKVTFGRTDIVALHDLPSAKAIEPLVVRAPRRRGILWHGTRLCVFLCVLIVVLAGAGIGLIESGLADAPLNRRAEAALNTALGDKYRAAVGRTVIRITSQGTLALRAQDVTLVERQSDVHLMTTATVSIALDPLALLTGRVAVSRIAAEGVALDPAILPQGRAIDLTSVRIAAVPDALERVFEQIDVLSSLIARSSTSAVEISDVSLTFAGPRNASIPVRIDRLTFDRGVTGDMLIAGTIDIAGSSSELRVDAASRNGRIVALNGSMTGVPLDPLLFRPKTETELAFGIVNSANVTLEASRAGEGSEPVLGLGIETANGAFHAGGFTSDLLPSTVAIAYDFQRQAIDIQPSQVRIGRSLLPLSGGLIDLDRIDPASRKGFAIDLLLTDALSAPVDVAEPPLPFNAKLKGRYLTESRELVFDEFGVSSAVGSLAGSLALTFGPMSPQISFAAVIDRMQTAGVKQLWPWWVAKGARRWVNANLFGGTVNNGRIEVFLEQGRLSRTVGPVELDSKELNIRFDVENARMNIAGDIPPVRDVSGTLSLGGERMETRIGGGTVYFPSGRSVGIKGGNFVLPNVHEKPLIAEMKIEVDGEADAIAELVSYRPIGALQRTPFKVEDFSGPMSAVVGARFGLIAAQKPPPPVWQAEMKLEGVTLNTPVSGRAVSDVVGTLRIDNDRADLTSKARIDGSPMDLSVTEPVSPTSTAERRREISGTLNDEARKTLVPGLAGLLKGPVDVGVVIGADGKQQVSADLGRASLNLPWIGWSKGEGIAAKVSFTATAADGVTTIDGFDLDGDGFGARGALRADANGLESARLSSVRLASGDNFAANVTRQKNGFDIRVTGNAADIRPILAQLKNDAGRKAGSDAGNATTSITAKLDRAIGFNGESLGNVALTYVSRAGTLNEVDLSAVTGSGQAVVAKLVKEGADSTLELTSGDAGAMARFADIYANMSGGLLNLKLRDRGANSWRGTVDVRKFALVNEPRLQSMVSTPAGEDGRSLNQAVKRDIDVSTARFERGFAELLLDPGSIRVDRGVVRGVDIGATFQGTVRDRNGAIDMTGTFMPAYGLNRLFAELPLIGFILGNGRDRGLIGITFKLEGTFTKPELTINPLSIIAPGVFRSIFEFR